MKRKLQPILFNTEMVGAILEGRKTQTRRVVKFPAKSTTHQISVGESDYPLTENFSRIKMGDILWVRETWMHSDDLENPYWYKQNIEEEYLPEYHSSFKWKPSIHMPREAARLFLEVTNVRVERLQDISDQDAIAEGIEITDNWYWTNGALNYMFGEDSGYRREYFFNDGNYGIDGVPDHNGIKASFFSLWASCYKWESVIANPWVWVYELKQIDKPVDF